MQAVRFNEYGDVNVLRVAEVPVPEPGPRQVLVAVRAAGINPGEAAIREGLMREWFPAHFPEGQGSDLAGVVTQLGDNVDEFNVGDEVLGFTNRRASHAEYVLVEVDEILHRPPQVPWNVAGSLFVAGTTAYASVRSVSPTAADTVVVAGAAGGVGVIAAQLARQHAKTVLGLASEPHHLWLSRHGILPIDYHGDVVERIKAAAPHVDAFIDTFGNDYLHIAAELGIPPDRTNTIINFSEAQRYGSRTDGNATAANTDVLGELATMVDQGHLDVPIAHAYRLAEVRSAYRELEQRHTHGKITLNP